MFTDPLLRNRLDNTVVLLLPVLATASVYRATTLWYKLKVTSHVESSLIWKCSFFLLKCLYSVKNDGSGTIIQWPKWVSKVIRVIDSAPYFCEIFTLTQMIHFHMNNIIYFSEL
jgi:hypothetical protein